MPAIVAPQPMRPQSVLAVSTQIPLLPVEFDDPFICHTPKRDRDVAFPLMSPIRLDRGKRHHMTKSPTPCSSIKRPSAYAPRTPRRRRHYSRTPDFSTIPRHQPIDSLPWISALDDPFTAPDMWDIADLSQLAPDEHQNAAGPIRRRKSSTRIRRLVEPLPPLVEPRSAAATPPPRLPPQTDVAFWNLMPVFSTPRKPDPSSHSSP